MAKKISQFTELTTLSGDETVPVAHQGATYRIKIRNLKTLINKNDLGLGSVDNTSDLNKPISTATNQALSSKADVGHDHNISEVRNLQSVIDNLYLTLDDKATIQDISAHTHEIQSVNGLQTILDNKANSGDLEAKANTVHNHDVNDVQGLQTILDAKASTLHSHGIEDIENLETYIINTIAENIPDGVGDVTVNNIEW